MPTAPKNNFSLLRLVAAFAVMVFHATVIIGAPRNFTGTPLVSLGSLAVSVFFAISGFLLAGSLVKNPDAVRYMKHRFLRIYPGFAVCSFLTALLLYLFTSTGHKQWPGLMALNLTIFGFERSAEFPGVFDRNPVSVVNGSLWSLAYEIFCYGLLLAVHQLSRNFPAGVLCFLLILVWAQVYSISAGTTIILGIHTTQLTNYGAFFFSGAAISTFRIVPTLVKDIICLIVIGICISVSNETFWQPLWIGMVICVPYFIVRLAFLPPVKPARVFDRYDISYGVYLYHFPIMQSVVAVGGASSAMALTGISLFFVVPIALASWVFIERPFIRAKWRDRKSVPNSDSTDRRSP